MLAAYCLSRHLPSFEFFYWLVMVQADGASKIVFDTRDPKLRKFRFEDVFERFRSIILPGPDLAGLPSRLGLAHESQLDATASQLFTWYNSGRRFKRLRSVKSPAKCDYTVTIRANAAGARARDSNEAAWRQFAKEIDAVVIEDYYVRPIHLHDRVALYAGAKMNFGVCNGPIALLSLTEYPVAMFVNSQSARNSNIRWGQEPDTKLPWMLENQHMIWQEDDLDSLRRAFDGIR